MYLSTSQV